METVLAFSRNLRSSSPSYENFVEKIQEVRYADGKLDGYCSRLHYFSEWIRDNQKRNIVRDLTSECGHSSPTPVWYRLQGGGRTGLSVGRR